MRFQFNAMEIAFGLHLCKTLFENLCVIDNGVGWSLIVFVSIHALNMKGPTPYGNECCLSQWHAHGTRFSTSAFHSKRRFQVFCFVKGK